MDITPQSKETQICIITSGYSVNFGKGSSYRDGSLSHILGPPPTNRTDHITQGARYILVGLVSHSLVFSAWSACSLWILKFIVQLKCAHALNLKNQVGKCHTARANIQKL